MQVLRVCSFSTFALPPALPPCSCPLAFQRQVRRLTSRMSSESYPGYPECVVSCHGAGRFANSIRPLCGHLAWGTPLPAKSARKLGLDHGVGHFRPLSITRQRHLVAYHGTARSHASLWQVCRQFLSPQPIVFPSLINVFLFQWLKRIVRKSNSYTDEILCHDLE